MKRLTDEEVSTAKRIFDNVNTLANGYYGHKTLEEIKKYVSMNRWIMFPVSNIESKSEGASFGAPNMFVSFDQEEIVDNGRGQAEAYVGVTYGNSTSMLWLNDTLRRAAKRNRFIPLVNGLGSDWYTYISKKVHFGHQNRVPSYYTESESECSTVTADDIRAAISLSDNSLYRRGEIVDDEEVVDCISVFSVETETTVDSFNICAKKAFEIFQAFLNL